MIKFVILYPFTYPQVNLETFADNFKVTLKNLAQKFFFLVTAIADFNAKFTNWYNKDKQVLKVTQLTLA